MFHDKARTRPPFVCHFIKIIHHIMHSLVGCRQRFLKKNCHLKEQTNLSFWEHIFKIKKAYLHVFLVIVATIATI